LIYGSYKSSILQGIAWGPVSKQIKKKNEKYLCSYHLYGNGYLTMFTRCYHDKKDHFMQTLDYRNVPYHYTHYRSHGHLKITYPHSNKIDKGGKNPLVMSPFNFGVEVLRPEGGKGKRKLSIDISTQKGPMYPKNK
jgi:hypothetical protein